MGAFSKIAGSPEPAAKPRQPGGAFARIAAAGQAGSAGPVAKPKGAGGAFARIAAAEGRVFPHRTTSGFKATPESGLQKFGRAVKEAFTFHRSPTQLGGDIIAQRAREVDPAESSRQGRVVYQTPEGIRKRQAKQAERVEPLPPQGFAETAGRVVGTLGREVADPIALATMVVPGAQATLPARAGIAAGVGGAYEAGSATLSQVAKEGNITDPKEIALRAALGAVAAPVLGEAVRAIPKAVGAFSKVFGSKTTPETAPPTVGMAGAAPEPLPASTAGAAQVAGADVGMVNPLPIGERVAEATKAAVRAVSPLVGGRSIRLLDPKAKLSPTLQTLRNKIEHPQEFELPAGQVAESDFTEKVLAKSGEFTGDLNRAIDPLRVGALGYLPKNARAQLATEIRTGATTPAASRVRSLLDNVHRYANESGLDVGYTQNYFPRIYRLDVLKTNKGATDFVKTLGRHGIDAEDADDVLRRILDEDGAPVGEAGETAPKGAPGQPSWQKSRTLRDIPDEELKPFLYSDPRTVLRRYVGQVVRRAEHAKIFGARGEKLEQAIPEIRKELSQAGTRLTQEDELQLRGISDALIGRYKPIVNKRLQKVSQLAGSYQLMRSLTLSTLSSLAEPFIALERGGVTAFGSGVYSSLGYAGKQAAHLFNKNLSKSRSRQDLEDLGLIVDDSLVDVLTEFGASKSGMLLGEAADASAFPSGAAVKIFFKANLLEPWTNYTRSIGLGTGKKSITNTIAALGKKPGLMTQRLNELGVDPSQSQAWLNRTGGDFMAKDPYGDAMRTALTRFVNDVVMMPRPAVKPLWASDPHWQLINQLKSYQGTFGNTVGRRWLDKLAKAGQSKEDLAKAAGVVGTAGLMTTVAMLANEIREMAKFGPKGDPKFEDEEMPHKVMRAMDRAGFSGGLQPAIDMAWGQRFGKPGLVQGLGPTAGQLSDIIEALPPLAREGKSAALKYQAISAIPGWQAIPSDKKREIRQELISNRQFQ